MRSWGAGVRGFLRPTIKLVPGAYELRLATVEGEDMSGRILELSLKDSIRQGYESCRIGQIRVVPNPAR